MTRPLPERSRSGLSWMVSLADLLALMLTFFVLIFSMNAVQFSEWQAVVSSFRKQFNPHEARILPRAETEATATRRAVYWGKSLDYLAVLFRHQLAEASWSGAYVTRSSDRVVLSLPSHLVFASGGTTPTAEAAVLLEALSEQLAGLENRIEVAGHTDPTPVRGDSFASNWDLSLRRAESVAGLLHAAGYGRPVTVLGHADGHYSDLAPELEGAARARLGRRVDIAIVASDEEEADDAR